ncbi:MAG: methyltransferase domain-containing protein [Synergistaceae bacterium]|jgi:SAM-dependent methyltransferase|nr:methyltransferase domain-containing protein [Synergistaceae bacterium]
MTYWADKFKEMSLLENGEYECVDGIIRQRDVYSDAQKQTEQTFAFKWRKRDTYESDAVKAASFEWMSRGFFGDTSERVVFPGCRFLDAGCGSGFSALVLFESELNKCHYLGVDISTAVDIAKTRFSEKKISGEFMQADILRLPFNERTFDVIFSNGVLHHTDSTELGIKKLAPLLVEGGRFLFYVYRKKSPIREWTDDYVRECIKNLSDEEAWKALEPLTKLGKALGDLNAEINIPEDIAFLGIPKGSINVQRLFYWHVIKTYFRPEFSIEEMNHINFDWFRPANCHRQTPEQVEKWCSEAGLKIDRMYAEEAGMYVTATKL